MTSFGWRAVAQIPDAPMDDDSLFIKNDEELRGGISDGRSFQDFEHVVDQPSLLWRRVLCIVYHVLCQYHVQMCYVTTIYTCTMPVLCTHVLFNMLHTVLYNLSYVSCCMSYVFCTLHYLLFSMYGVLCIVYHVLCSMYYVHTWYAPCQPRLLWRRALPPAGPFHRCQKTCCSLRCGT